MGLNFFPSHFCPRRRRGKLQYLLHFLHLLRRYMMPRSLRNSNLCSSVRHSLLRNLTFRGVWDDFISVLPVLDTSIHVCSVLNCSMNLHPTLLHIPRVVLCRHRSIQTGSFCGWLVRLPISFHHKPFELGRCARTIFRNNLLERLKMFSTGQPSAR